MGTVDDRTVRDIPANGCRYRHLMAAGRVDVWWTTPAQVTPRLLDLLNDVERERHERFRMPADKARFVTGRAVTRSVVADVLGIKPEQVVLDSTCPDCGKPHGRPVVVADGPVPTVSISHSGDRIAVAVLTDTGALGVDVEQISDRVGLDSLIESVLSPAERASFDGADPQRRKHAFFTYWARKEAILKATGKGITVQMSSLTMSAYDQPAALLDPGKAPVLAHQVRMADLHPGEGYRASVAVIDAEVAGEDWVDQHDADPLVTALG
jgi:4'-phosphopantetheinyl transferase